MNTKKHLKGMNKVLYKYYQGESICPYNDTDGFKCALWESEKIFYDNYHGSNEETTKGLANWVASHLGGWLPMSLSEALTEYFDGAIPQDIKRIYL